MVNTFMPYSDFDKVAQCLDYRRLGKQRVEVWQIYRALTRQSTGWVNHPATKMWRSYEAALLQYGIAMCSEWIKRGYNDTMLPRFEEALKPYQGSVVLCPNWIFDTQSQLAYRSNLIRKDSAFYQHLWPDVSAGLEYTWGKLE